jgi:hypothetical protein
MAERLFARRKFRRRILQRHRQLRRQGRFSQPVVSGRERLRAGQRVRATRGPMTRSATPLFERLLPGDDDASQAIFQLVSGG